MAVVLKDIAKATGFSVTTVSLALNNSPRISGRTKQIVFDAAKQLNYVPNLIARSLVTRQSRMIGLIVRTFDSVVLSSVAAKLEQTLADLGYGLLLVTTRPPRDEMGALRLLEAQQVDGIFLFPTLPPDKRLIEYVNRSKIPVVLLSFGAYELFTDTVYYDREYAAYMITRHLVELGHTEIGLICGQGFKGDTNIDGDRLNGYIRALAESNIPYNLNNTIIPSGKNEYEGGYKAARELFRRRNLTALAASTDAAACGATHYLLRHGIRVPEDVSIASNDSTAIAEFAPVPITASHYDEEALVRHAIPLMADRIERGMKRPPTLITLKASLEVRASTAPLALDRQAL